MTGIDEAEALLSLVARSGLAAGEPIARVVATEMAFRAAQILAYGRIMTVRGEYATTNQAMIFAPDPELVPERDALADEADTLRPIDIIDLLSDVDLPCVAPRLHRGWQDRVQSCREARRITAEATGVSLDEQARNPLLASLAACNRALKMPPPVDLPAELAATWLLPVLQLIETMIPADADGLRAVVQQLRAAHA